MDGNTDLKRISDEILDSLPDNDDEAAHVALAVAAAKCIDAGMTDDQAGSGLLACLRGLRGRLRKARAN